MSTKGHFNRPRMDTSKGLRMGRKEEFWKKPSSKRARLLLERAEKDSIPRLGERGEEPGGGCAEDWRADLGILPLRRRIRGRMSMKDGLRGLLPEGDSRRPRGDRES